MKMIKVNEMIDNPFTHIRDIVGAFSEDGKTEGGALHLPSDFGNDCYNYLKAVYGERLLVLKDYNDNILQFISNVDAVLTANRYTIQRLYVSTLQIYKALDNYTLTELTNDTNTGATTLKTASDLNNVNTNATNNGITETQTFTTTYNSGDSLAPETKTKTTNPEIVNTGTGSTTTKGNTDGTSVNVYSHTLTRYGNIGTQTTADILNKERELAKFSVIDFIVSNIFVRNFTLNVFDMSDVF